MEEDEPTGASQHKAEETEEGQDAETLFKNAAKKETECFPRVWMAGNQSFPIQYRILF